MAIAHSLGQQIASKTGANPILVDGIEAVGPLEKTLRFGPLHGGEPTGRITVKGKGIDLEGRVRPHSTLIVEIPETGLGELRPTWRKILSSLRRRRVFSSGYGGDEAPFPVIGDLPKPDPSAPLEAWFAYREQEKALHRKCTLIEIAKIKHLDPGHVRNVASVWRRKRAL